MSDTAMLGARWMPLKVTQIVGGRAWSLAITRLGPVHDDTPTHAADRERPCA